MSHQSSSQKLEAALYYASLGWPVIPLHTLLAGGGCSCQKPDCAKPGQHPRTEHGLRDATTDSAQIRDWWSQWPDANLGYVMGKKPRLIVLDIDGEKKGSSS